MATMVAPMDRDIVILMETIEVRGFVIDTLTRSHLMKISRRLSESNKCDDTDHSPAIVAIESGRY